MDDKDQQQQARVLKASGVKLPSHHIGDDHSSESTSVMDVHQFQKGYQPEGKILSPKK